MAGEFEHKVGDELFIPRRLPAINIAAFLSAGFLCLLGSVVLLGWYTHLPSLIQINPAFVPMQYNTALGFILMGAAILAMISGHDHVAFASGGLASVVGILTLLEYALGFNFGIDELFMEHYISVATSHPGRMAPNTALGFLLGGMAVVASRSIADSKLSTQLQLAVGALVTGMGVFSLFGYLIGVDIGYAWGQMTQMAIHTSTGFVMLGLVLVAEPLMRRRDQQDRISYLGPLSLSLLFLAISIFLTSILYVKMGNGIPWALLVVLFAVALALSMFTLKERENLRISMARLVKKRTRDLAQANKQLVESATRLLQAQEISGMGFLSWNLASNEIELSAGVLKLYRLDPEKCHVTADFVTGLVHPDDRDFALRLMTEALESKENYDLDHRVVRPDGSIIWVQAHAEISFDKEGNPASLLGTVVDITERKLAEREHELLSVAIGQVMESIVITNAQGDIQYVNPAFEHSSGFSSEEVVGQNPRLLKSGEQDAAFYQEMWSTLSSGNTWSGRIINKKKDGTLFTEDVVISPIRNNSVNTTNYVAVKRDVTAKLGLEEQVRQSQKMESIGLLAGGVAHDFNNMLGVIMGHTEMLLDNSKPSDSEHDVLQEIMTAAQRSSNLTRQLLTFARKQTISPRILDLNAAVGGSLTMLKRLIGENIELKWSPGSENMRVLMDPGQIDQIMANLVVNARDAIEGTGILIIETDVVRLNGGDIEHYGGLPGEYVRMSVSDDGCGMEEDTRDKIFDPFFTTKALGKSTGLGLSTVFGIVKQNNGFINVYSEPGDGTTFRIYFPLHESEVSSIEDDEQKKEIARGTETILVVEDEVSLLHMTKKILENQGYTVLTESSPSGALNLIQSREDHVHLLLTDVVMPEMNGGQLARELQNQHPEMKCLFMSGYTADVISRQGKLDADILFVEKPFTTAELNSKVREALDSS